MVKGPNPFRGYTRGSPEFPKGNSSGTFGRKGQPGQFPCRITLGENIPVKGPKVKVGAEFPSSFLSWTNVRKKEDTGRDLRAPGECLRDGPGRRRSRKKIERGREIPKSRKGHIKKMCRRFKKVGEPGGLINWRATICGGSQEKKGVQWVGQTFRAIHTGERGSLWIPRDESEGGFPPICGCSRPREKLISRVDDVKKIL